MLFRTRLSLAGCCEAASQGTTADWLSPRQDAHCWYVEAWIGTKTFWQLTIENTRRNRSRRGDAAHMKHKCLWTVAVAGIFAVGAAACGGDDSSDENDDDGTTVPAAETELGEACVTAQAAVTQLFEKVAAVANQPAAAEQVLGQTLVAETAAETACGPAQHALFVSELKNYHSSCVTFFAEYNLLFNQASITAKNLADIANNMEIAWAVQDIEALIRYLQPKTTGLETMEQHILAWTELDARTAVSGCPGKDQAVFTFYEVEPFLTRIDATLTGADETFTDIDTELDKIFASLAGLPDTTN